MISYNVPEAEHQGKNTVDMMGLILPGMEIGSTMVDAQIFEELSLC
tara:strand:+ start:298 stop:435 length:138 start_codon:yes stop_codon:yes gene_type:complete